MPMVSGLGFGTEDLDLRFLGLGFKVLCSVFSILYSVFRVKGLGMRVWSCEGRFWD